MGMVNYLGRYLPELSTVMHPMSDLLKSDTVWSWGPSQEDSLKKIKEMITSAPVLVFYDPKKETTVSADASSYGLGAVLLQQHEDKLLPVAYCSRTLTSAETRYAQIEKECLAGVWACERFSQYLVGLESFHLLTDHRPLVPLINSLDLDRTPLRCQRLLMRLMRFNAKAEYVPGKKLVVVDYLSRKPLPTTEEADTEVAMYVECAEESRPILDKMLRRIANSTLSDAELQAAVHLTRNGWPDQIASIPEIIKKFHSVRSELSTSNDLLLFRNRIVIPSSMRSDILRKLHEGHQGLTKCRGRASMTVWWPTINKDIQEEVATCQFCQESKPAQRKEPLVVTSLPERPWQKIAADLCELNGKRYLVMIDYYSRYIEIAYLTDMTSKQVIGRMKSIFARWGIPEELFSDNGTQFTAAGFQEFLNEYAIKHTTSSPTCPQANGEAEIAVKIAKSMLKQEDPFEALMSYRSTPSTATGISPAELIMGRKMRTKVPTLTQNLKPKWIKFEDLKEFDHKKKGSYRFFFNRRNSARPLPELRTGDHVRIREGKGWSSPAIIQSRTEEPISYWVKTKTNVLRRNRRHIMRIAVPSTASILPTDSTVLPCPVFSKPVPAVPDIDKPSISDPRPLQFESEAPAEDLLVPNGDVPDTTSPMPTTRSGRIVRKPVRFRDL